MDGATAPTWWCVPVCARSFGRQLVRSWLRAFEMIWNFFLESNVGQIHHFGLITHALRNALSLSPSINWNVCAVHILCMCGCVCICIHLPSYLAAGCHFAGFIFVLPFTLTHACIPSTVYWFQWKSKHVLFLIIIVKISTYERQNTAVIRMDKMCARVSFECIDCDAHSFLPTQRSAALESAPTAFAKRMRNQIDFWFFVTLHFGCFGTFVSHFRHFVMRLLSYCVRVVLNFIRLMKFRCVWWFCMCKLNPLNFNKLQAF